MLLSQCFSAFLVALNFYFSFIVQSLEKLQIKPPLCVPVIKTQRAPVGVTNSYPRMFLPFGFNGKGCRVDCRV